ncbi:cytochrome c oxidase accessory protein CcoG [Neptunomonas concharum]|uniref:Cytochrome c oxidase accessory protein CcoG n=1 Tax=Neptunomonas concharum TaxID=1031538 RepID=A0A5P1RBU0_9GAMM|nr:cytochrome c oxidase accessory protein CcoG [Neptunomonas concharum]QEQ97119.1 cytochrome c oxidase accessory protein CcoG [Neptunomonas concharum]
MQQIPVEQIEVMPFSKDEKIHVRLTEGRFQQLRRLISWPLLFAYFALVWIQVGDKPWLLFDFSQRSIHLFGNSLSWHDLPLLAGVMIAGASLLFFMAVAWGRVWCGFACPQSIWTWVFIRIENWTEGRASLRAKQDSQPMTGGKLVRRIAKHSLWISVSLLTAITFTGYFIPIRELFEALLNLSASQSVVGWITIMAALTYANAGLVREKICLHACPYSRFQGVMFDDHTRTVSYDRQRGEPRGHLRCSDGTTGDCVDCNLCVQVCPTGIDIRHGLQAACIDCGACIDACDQVMDKLKRPRGLIRFTSDALLNKQNSPIWRPRLLGYLLILIIATGATVFGLTQKTDILIEIRRDRGALFHQPDDDTVCNRYLIKAEPFHSSIQRLTVTAAGISNIRLEGLSVLSKEHYGYWIPYQVCTEHKVASGTPIKFTFSGAGLTATKETRFITRNR